MLTALTLQYLGSRRSLLHVLSAVAHSHFQKFRGLGSSERLWDLPVTALSLALGPVVCECGCWCTSPPRPGASRGSERRKELGLEQRYGPPGKCACVRCVHVPCVRVCIQSLHVSECEHVEVCFSECE